MSEEAVAVEDRQIRSCGGLAQQEYLRDARTLVVCFLLAALVIAIAGQEDAIVRGVRSVEEGVMAQLNGSNTARTAGLLAFGFGVIGLLVWGGVRGSTWLRGELAYQRWRRQRRHTIILPSPGPGTAQYATSGRTLVWDEQEGRPAT